MYERGHFQDGIHFYETKRVAETCPLLYRAWIIKEMEMIKKEGKIPLDYLQIFRFSIVDRNGKKVQKIVHEQEQPEYKKIIYVEPEGGRTGS